MTAQNDDDAVLLAVVREVTGSFTADDLLSGVPSSGTLHSWVSVLEPQGALARLQRSLDRLEAAGCIEVHREYQITAIGRQRAEGLPQ